MWLARDQTLVSSRQREDRTDHRGQQMNTPWRCVRNGDLMTASGSPLTGVGAQWHSGPRGSGCCEQKSP